MIVLRTNNLYFSLQNKLHYGETHDLMERNEHHPEFLDMEKRMKRLYNWKEKM